MESEVADLMRVSFFNQDGTPKNVGEPDVLDAKLTSTLDGEETLELTLRRFWGVSKQDRVVLMINALFREFIVSSPQETSSTCSLVCKGAMSELESVFVKDFTISNASCSAALAQALKGTRWTPGTTTASTKWSISKQFITAREAVQAVCDTFGQRPVVSFQVDRNGIAQRVLGLAAEDSAGQEVEHRFEFRHDLLSVKRTVDASTLMTRVFAFGKKTDDKNELSRITMASANGGKEFVEDTTASARFGVLDGITLEDDITEPAQLLSAASLMLRQNSAPKETFEADVATFDFPNPRPGDLVQIIDTEWSPALRLDAQITKVEQDLLNPANTKITIGNTIPTMRMS